MSALRPVRVIQFLVFSSVLAAGVLVTQLKSAPPIEAPQTQSPPIPATVTLAPTGSDEPHSTPAGTPTSPALPTASPTRPTEPLTPTSAPPQLSPADPGAPPETAALTETAPTVQPTHQVVAAAPRATRPSPTPTGPAAPAGEPILTMGASNTTSRGYRWGPPNLATHDGFVPSTMLDTDWTPPECWPDPENPSRPTRMLTVAQCAIFYYKPRNLLLFLNRPFSGQAYYEEMARVIVHIESYEDELGLPHSLKIIMGPVTYDGGVIGSPQSVIALGARVVDVADIVATTRSVTGVYLVTDNVHLDRSAYFWGVLNLAVQKAMAGGPGTYTLTAAEIPPFTP